MAYAFAATNDAYASGSGTVQTISWAPASGDSAITLSLSGGTTGTWSQSDATDGAMTKIGSERTVASAVIGVCFYKHSLSSGTRNLTSTRSANGSARTVAYWRYTGLDTTAGPQTSVYPTACSPSTTTDATTTGNLTPSSQPALLFGLCIDPNSGFSISSGTGFTSRGQMAARNTGAGDTSIAEDKRLTSTSAVACTWTCGGTSATPSWAFAAIFTEAGGATTFSTLVGARFGMAGARGLAG